MDLAKYFSQMNTELICKAYKGFQLYKETRTFVPDSDTDYAKAVIDYVTRYSKSDHSNEEIKIALYEEMAKRLFQSQELLSKGSAYDQVRWERDIALEQLEEIGCSLGQKMDHIKSLIADNKAQSKPRPIPRSRRGMPGYSFLYGLDAPDLVSLHYNKDIFSSMKEAVAQAKADGHKMIPDNELPKRLQEHGVLDTPENREWLKNYRLECQKRTKPGYDIGYTDGNGIPLHTGDLVKADNDLYREIIWDSEQSFFRLKGLEDTRLEIYCDRWTVVRSFAESYPKITDIETDVLDQEK